jgi:hypothetical protein
MIRAMMGLRPSVPRIQERVAQARALLTFLAEGVPLANTPYSLLLRGQLELLIGRTDPYLFHEHLEECNEPIYFMDFCERLAAKGLRYLGESEFRVMVPSTSFPAEVQSRLQAVAPSLLEMGSTWTSCRPARRCLPAPAPPNRGRPSAGRVFVLPRSGPAPAPDLGQLAREFAARSGMSLSTPIPIVSPR